MASGLLSRLFLPFIRRNNFFVRYARGAFYQSILQAPDRSASPGGSIWYTWCTSIRWDTAALLSDSCRGGRTWLVEPLSTPLPCFRFLVELTLTALLATGIYYLVEQPLNQVVNASRLPNAGTIHLSRPYDRDTLLSGRSDAAAVLLPDSFSAVANSYFQFKQFRIEQQACAMKVSTDACVLGAVAAVAGATRLLDIGTGTGLLALMAAQRAPEAHIEAVELEPAAAAQARANFAASPWAARLVLHAMPLAQLAASRPAAFDHILCNPPFFRNSLRSPDAQRTSARHAAADTLSFAELASFSAGFLTTGGQLTVLLPPPEMQEFEREAARTGLFPAARCVLHHRPGSKPLRHITAFGRHPAAVLTRTLMLHPGPTDAYSAEFRELLGPFYLAL